MRMRVLACTSMCVHSCVLIMRASLSVLFLCLSVAIVFPQNISFFADTKSF